MHVRGALAARQKVLGPGLSWAGRGVKGKLGGSWLYEANFGAYPPKNPNLTHKQVSMVLGNLAQRASSPPGGVGLGSERVSGWVHLVDSASDKWFFLSHLKLSPMLQMVCFALSFFCVVCWASPNYVLQ